jgi:hypothetical protein
MEMINNQPERSKRENKFSHTKECIPRMFADCPRSSECQTEEIKSPFGWTYYACMNHENLMRCSEHCGNTVREVQEASSPRNRSQK